MRYEKFGKREGWETETAKWKENKEGNWKIGKIKYAGRRRNEKSKHGRAAGISSLGNRWKWKSERRDKQNSNLTVFALQLKGFDDVRLDVWVARIY